MADEEARIQALEQQLQTLLQTQLATQIAQQAQPAAQQVAPQPTQPGPFALTPALANQNVMDLASTQGIKLYKSIITPLDIKFDGTSRKLVLFMDELRHKADENGWNHTLLSVSDRHPITPTTRNLLLVHHRLMTIDDVRAHAEAYIGTPARVAQDSNMMYMFIRDSLSEGARLKMANEHAQYDIKNGISSGATYYDHRRAATYLDSGYDAKVFESDTPRQTNHLSLQRVSKGLIAFVLSRWPLRPKSIGIWFSIRTPTCSPSTTAPPGACHSPLTTLWDQ
jgi:hypothetical protein